jgi:glucoamylase
MRAATAALSIPLLSVASAVTRGFSVVLTGQDGFSSDQAPGFQPTAQEFQFGVRSRRYGPDLHVPAEQCAEGRGRDHPADTSRATELDPARVPVVVQPVTVP